MIAPGLIGEAVPTAAFRTFLGAPPQNAVEKRLLRHMTSFTAVGPWFISRRRVREAANEFIELDGATIDPEIMLRHCHVFFVRRQLFQEMLEKQVSILEAGKPPKEPEPELLSCLQEINDTISPRVMYERKRLEHAKAISNFPHRRELAAKEALERWDTLCMLRCLEQDVLSEEYTSNNGNQRFSREFISSCEAQAKAFLPLSAVSESAEKLAQLFVRIGASVAADAAQIPQQLKPLDKKDEKMMLKAFVPGDYQKTGLNVARIRPVDATSVFRFYGERVLTANTTSADTNNSNDNNSNNTKKPSLDPLSNFRRAIWGNVFRRYATNAPFLSNSMSQYWGIASSQLHPQPPLSKMPFDIADIVCHQQKDICPATRLRAQFMYCHQDHAKQLWRSELTVPSIRMLSVTGAQCAEDMLCSVLVDSFFNELEGRQVVTTIAAEKSETAANVKKNKKGDENETAASQKARVRMLATTNAAGNMGGGSSANNSTSNSSSTGGKSDAVSSVPLLSDEKMRQVVSFVNEMVSLRSSSMDTLLQRAQTSVKNICPPLSDEEIDWQAPAVAETSSSTLEINSDEDDEMSAGSAAEEEFAKMLAEEGAEEEANVKIPNEEFERSSNDNKQ